MQVHFAALSEFAFLPFAIRKYIQRFLPKLLVTVICATPRNQLHMGAAPTSKCLVIASSASTFVKIQRGKNRASGNQQRA
jgi:hypothetical protein